VIKSPRSILALLTALNLLNYFDRFVVNAVGPKIQEHLGITSSQLGLVTSVFMIGYFVTSPVFGWLGDRYPRKGLIAAGIALWSLATAASGLAGALGTLLVMRAVVGIGEASYATLAPTIIDDVTPAKSKNRWLGVFYVAIPVGSALGVVIGANLERHFGWRNAFFIAGGPGLIAAIAMLFVAEPAREETKRRDGASTSAIGDIRVLAKSRVYVWTVAGYIAQTFALGGFIAWAVPFLYRKHCLDLHIAGDAFGGVTIVSGIVGTAIGSVLSDRVPGEDRTRACLKVCAVSSLVGTPLAALALVWPTPFGFIALLGVCELAVFASIAPTNVAILKSVPPTMRASAMALSIFSIHLLGDVISPPIVGAVSDAMRDGVAQCSTSTGLTLGMLILPLALGLSAVFWGLGARREPSQSPR
jgi:MFS transporter, Spinster family, sphingosine-1-phosphate transporter